jgi:uncharacterized integral membrane protein
MTQEQRPAPTDQEEPSLIDRLKLIGALIFFGALLLFFFQNLQDAKINFLWFDWTTDMIWALLGSALLGAIATFLAATIRRRRKPGPPPAER